jgi:cytochrome b subunit of formate dehydrogenase
MMEKNQAETEQYQRFCVLHRLLHLVVIVTFTLLALTGFALKYSAHGWAQWLVSMIGGADGAGYLHRISAAALYVCVMIHLLWLGYYKLVFKGKFSGPQSVLPGLQDFRDLYHNLRYIFGKGTPPLFNRFSYLEKVDYWAVLLGMQSMGITGLIMWYPEFFSTLVPGYFINIANELHFHEAILAVAYIGFVHMTSTHLDPEVFPMQKSIFNGMTTTEMLRRQHPKEWESIQASGQQEAALANEK